MQRLEVQTLRKRPRLQIARLGSKLTLVVTLLLQPVANALCLGCAGAKSAPAVSAAERLNAEGLRRLERGDLSAAEATFHDALQEAELVDDLKGQAEAWNNLGALAMAQAHVLQAIQYHATALSLHESRGVRDDGQIRTHANLGMALLAAGQAKKARGHFEAAIQLANELDRSKAAQFAYIGLAAVTLGEGDAKRALQMIDIAMEQARQAGNLAIMAAALTVAGSANEALGNLSRASTQFEQALELDRARELPTAVISDLDALARIAERAGDPEAAAAYLGRKARIARLMGDFDNAIQALHKAIQLADTSAEEQLAIELEALLNQKATIEFQK